MQFNFYKYHGTGNDFIIIDQSENPELNLSDQIIRFLCDRKLGIGADGLMVYYLCNGYDFGMTYFNSDGFESTMCGNGGRCLAAYWKSKGHSGNSVRFKGIDGEHIAQFLDADIIKLGMNDVNGLIKIEEGFAMNTGSPHFVSFVSNIDKLNVKEEGKRIRYSKEFAPDGVNVNFVEIKEGKIHIRTYERGVEDETLSCGTGSVAAAIATYLKTGPQANSFEIVAPGGILKVSFVQSGAGAFKEIFLEGSATFVFKGFIEI